MARVPSKHGLDQDFEGFLNNLQDWELSLKDKDKKLKSQSAGKEKLQPSAQKDNARHVGQLSTGNGRPGQSKEHGNESSQKIEIVGDDRRPMGKNSSIDNPSTARQYDYLRQYDAISNLSSGLMTEESSVDANSEKELGNEYFKQKKFKEAIDCYSRSIALSPTAVAYANRAMAYLKIKRFQDAEDDCTEALNLDDRYIKAYSRRSTARKELGKLKESIEDSEFALRLEPQNQEIKKQHTEAKSLYEKEILKKASGALRGSMHGSQQAKKSEVERNGHVGIQPVSSSSQMTSVSPKQDNTKRKQKTGKEELKPSVQELAARAAALAAADAAKNISPPNSAYQFEVSWRGLSGDRTLQARLLKATSPDSLAQIFKNALSAPLLIDLIRCIATFFNEEMDLAVRYLENLTKVSRFDMIIMCLSSADKADVQRIWNEVLCNKGTPPEHAETLNKLRSRYLPQAMKRFASG
ncbi:hypothetical protein LguiB_006368 [Lonicera macranthoides]